jgi:cation diffusion facilitator CzcD-associated flavoprotein CzcO
MSTKGQLPWKSQERSSQVSTDEIRAGVERWAADFEQAVTAGNAEELGSLFGDVSYLRDNGALTWDFRQFHGRDAVVSTLLAVVGDIKPTNFRLSESLPAPGLLGEGPDAVVEGFLDFDTVAGHAIAVINGIPDTESPYGFVVRALFTRIESLRGIEEPERFPRGAGFTPRFVGETWRQHHDYERQYVDREPEALVIGAGQSGLIAAAYLNDLGVDTLIIDKNERVGDNWRKRYDSLTLHNPTEMNNFPVLPFPNHIPEYMSKDHIADWLEIYARYLDLNVWLATGFEGASYDEASRWNATIRRADGTERVLHPQHIVLATGGIGGQPAIPTLPGLPAFEGKVVHSAAYTKASDYNAKNAVVVGTATSAHDIAQDLYDSGVNVTMLQRGPIVVNHVETANLAYAGYMDPMIPEELVDIRVYGIGFISPLREAGAKKYHQMAKEMDADLLQGLEAAGLRVGDGVDKMGWLDLFSRKGGGYYLNKGTSEIIAAGGIKILQSDRVKEFTAGGIALDDGTSLDADLVVLATGYKNRRVDVAEQFGQEIADRVGDIAVLDSEGEWAAMYAQTGQRGLWINGGGINQVRLGSARLALFIKADLDGLIPDSFRRPAKNSGERAFYEPAANA